MKKKIIVAIALLLSLVISACTIQEKEKFTVTFHPNNNSDTWSIQVDKDAFVPTQDEPLKENFIFKGWYSNIELTTEWIFETMKVTSKLDLYAKFESEVPLNTYTVTFNTNEGSALQEQSITEGSLLTKPENPTKAGYRFAGWYHASNLNKQWNFNKDKVAGNIELHAKWKVEKDYTEGIKLLSIGNSFSEDAHRYLWQILVSAGIPEDKIVIANMYIGGAELIQHYQNANNGSKSYTYQLFKGPNKVDTQNVSLTEAVSKETWDVITFQQASHHSGLSSTYESHLYELIRWAEALAANPDVELGWHMTWAYQQTSTHSGFANYEGRQDVMYHKIIEAVEKEVLPLSQIEFVIPAGTAIQNARTSYVGDKLTADGYHLTDPLGRYIAALTFYKQLTGLELSVDKVPFKPLGVSETDQEMAYEAVNHAIENPYEVTNSTYTVAPEPEPITVTGVQFSYTLTPGYWNTNATSITNGGSAFDLQFAATNIIPKGLLPVGSEIVVEPGYKYRVIFLDKEGEGYRVVHRTDNLTTTYVEIDEIFWGSYQYIAFNISNTEGTPIDHMLEEVSTKFRLYHPEGTGIGHIDEPLQFNLGTYEVGLTLPKEVDHTFVTNPVTPDYFTTNYVVTVTEGYKFRYALLVYEMGYLVLEVSDWQTESLSIDDTFKAEIELISFMVTKDESTDLSALESDTLISIDKETVPHVDQALYFVKGYWNNGASSITSTDTTSNSFIASNVLSKHVFLYATSLSLKEGYQVRLIFLTYDGVGKYTVVHRTENYVGTITMDEAFWGTYDYIAFNLSTTPTTNITERLEEVSESLSFSYELEFTNGYWNNNATSITSTDGIANNFIASYPVSRTLIPLGTVVKLEPGYKVRLIFLSYSQENGYKVLERTSVEYQNTVTLASHFYKEYPYIAFNLSTNPVTNITELKDEVASKLSLHKFEEDIVPHIDVLTFKQGFWADHGIQTAPATDGLYNNFIVSSTLSKAYFSDTISFTVAEGYMVRVIFLDYDFNQYKVLIRTNTFAGTTVNMDEAFWGNYQYVAFNISKSPASNILGEVEETALKLTFNTTL